MDQPTDGLFSECGEGWNCTHCASDADFHIPFVRGDKIQLLTTLYDGYNPDPTNPANGFGSFIRAELHGDVSTITNYAAFSSRAMVAYGCGRSYQIIEIDTSLFVDCVFTVQITAYANDGEGTITQEVCSQEFGEVPAKASTVLVKGVHSKRDCFGGCYGLPDAYVGDLIEYDNTLRFFGYVKGGDASVERVVSQGQSSSVSVEDQYIFQLGRPIPRFLHLVLIKQFLAGDTILVDDEEYLTPTSFSTSNEMEKGEMYLYGVTLTRECDTGISCS